MSKHLMGRVFVAAIAVAGALPLAPAADATPAERHCVVRVTGQRASGELRTTHPICHDSFAAAMGEAGRFGVTSWAIGIHYDGANWTGSSFTVSGDHCLSGWLNLSPSWINRVSSTDNGCPLIYHFDGYSLTGSSQTTMGPGGNLTGMNNKTNSIQYLS